MHTVLAFLGLTMAVGLFGWVVWRLAGWLGFMSVKRKKRPASPRPASPPNSKERLAGSLSRRALYSARRQQK